MNRQSIRAGWVKYGLLVALAAGGVAGGVYLSEGTAPPGVQPCSCHHSPAAAHRFALSSLDVKDTAEAPDLAVRGNAVVVAWGSKTGDAERTVFVARSADGGKTFDPPQAVSKAGVYKTPGRGKMGGHERRATPHLAADGDKLHLTWSEALPDASGLRMVFATSADDGAAFGPARPVHQGERAKAAFTALAVGPGGALGCVWLDDRNGNQQPFAAVRPAGADSFEPERLVAPGEDGKGVCPCCPTAACFAPDGTLFVAYRNIKDGHRDIAVARLKPGQSNFDGPFPVVENTWKFDGCPHDGPSLAVVGDSLHVVWMDARTGSQRAYHARANLTDMKFTARDLHPGVPGTQGNAKLHADDAGNLHAVWEESLGAEPAAEGHQHGPPKVGAGGGRVVMHAVMKAGQTDFGPAAALDPKPGAFQTRPAVVSSGGDLFVAWNELDAGGKVVVVTRFPGKTARE